MERASPKPKLAPPEDARAVSSDGGGRDGSGEGGVGGGSVPVHPELPDSNACTREAKTRKTRLSVLSVLSVLPELPEC